MDRTDLGKTPEQLRAEASEHEQRNHDRLYGDGDPSDYALSYWASDLTAREKRAQAAITENGGYADHLALFTTDGQLVAAIPVDGKWGTSWGLLDPKTDAFVGFVPFRPTRPGTLGKRGYREGWIALQSYATLQGSGRGLSGSVWVATKAKRDTDWRRTGQLPEGYETVPADGEDPTIGWVARPRL